MKTLVLLRHGQSVWNLENRFTGWADVDLSKQGLIEAQMAGMLLRQHGFTFDIAYTSVLKRAIRTIWTVLCEMNLVWVPVYQRWQFNERHYGALQGLNKAETAAEFGEEQVRLWRRSFNVPPPALPLSDPRHPGHDRRYKDVVPWSLPLAESLKDTVARVIPCWENEIVPGLAAGQRLIITAHNNTLRALIMHIEQMSETEIVDLEIPTGTPLIYEFTNDLMPVRRYYLDH